MRELRGAFTSRGRRFAVAASRFNELVVGKLVGTAAPSKSLTVRPPALCVEYVSVTRFLLRDLGGLGG